MEERGSFWPGARKCQLVVVSFGFLHPEVIVKPRLMLSRHFVHEHNYVVVSGELSSLLLPPPSSLLVLYHLLLLNVGFLPVGRHPICLPRDPALFNEFVKLDFGSRSQARVEN